MKEQADEAAQQADRLIALHSRYREELQAQHVTANVLALIDALFVNPLADANRAQRVLGVSAPTARNTLRTLEEHGIVREITGRNWGRVFLAPMILDDVLSADQ